MNRHHDLIHLSTLGRSLCGAVLAAVLVIGQPASRAATSSVTIGGPFSLTAPDGTTVTDQTYRGKWLLVYFGYTFCPSSCPTTLLEIATALGKLGPDADAYGELFARARSSGLGVTVHTGGEKGRNTNHPTPSSDTAAPIRAVSRKPIRR